MTSRKNAPKVPREGYVINPKTRYPIKIGGPTFNGLSTVIQKKLILEASQGTFAQKRLEKETKCPPGEVYRIKTRRCVKIGGKTFNSLSLREKNELLKGKRMEVKSVVGRRKIRTKTRQIPSKKVVSIKRSPTLYNRRSRRVVSPRRGNVKSYLESLEKGIKESTAVRMRSPRRSPVRNRSPRRSPVRKRSPRRSPVRKRSPRRSPVRKRSPRRSPRSPHLKRSFRMPSEGGRRSIPKRKVPFRIARSVSKEQINDILIDISKAGVRLSPEKKREIFSAFGK